MGDKSYDVGDGFTCPWCGVWVAYGILHECRKVKSRIMDDREEG